MISHTSHKEATLRAIIIALCFATLFLSHIFKESPATTTNTIKQQVASSLDVSVTEIILVDMNESRNIKRVYIDGETYIIEIENDQIKTIVSETSSKKQESVMD